MAATNDEPPYSSWSIAADFFYSENCSLGIVSERSTRFSLSPNPVKDFLLLNSVYDNQKNVILKIHSIEGKLIGSQNHFFTEMTSIDVSNYSKGVYFISILNEDGQQQVIKFVKE